MARVSIKELDNRVALTRTLLNKNKKNWEIVETLQKKFDISRVTAYDYIRRAKDASE